MDDKLIMTGFSELDKVLGGLRPGSLNVISARPGMGRTALALNIAANVASNSGKSVVYYSLEQSRGELAERLFSSWIIPYSKLDDEKLNNYETIRSITNGFEDLPIYIDDRIVHTPELFKERFEKLFADKVDVGLIIIDYLELISCTDKSFEQYPVSSDVSDSRQRETAVVRQALKLLAVDYQVPAIVVTQVSKKAEYREGCIPDIQDIRDGSGFEQEVDNIIFIVRPNCYSSESMVTGSSSDAKLIVAKNRFGERNVVIPIKWNSLTLSFSDI